MSQTKLTKPKKFVKGYNERAPIGFHRCKFHFAKFHWFQRKLNHPIFPKKTYLESGCFDGKTVDYLLDEFEKYSGLDASWENGLQITMKIYGHSLKIESVESSNSEEFKRKDFYETCINMRSFGRHPTCALEKYIPKLANSTRQNLIATLTNKKGLFWLVIYINKITFLGKRERYSFKDVLSNTIGNIHKVKRNEGWCKGYDIRSRLGIFEKFFIIETYELILFNKGGLF